jgi:engulfment/cell motility protein 1
MSLVTDLLTGTSSAIFTSKKNSSENPALCFSLVTSVSDSMTSTSLADFACSSAVQYAEWTDGFTMLLEKSIANRETADYILQLTEIGVKLALLDLTGEGVEVPAAPPELPDIPSTWNFHYDEDGGGLKEGLGGLSSLAGLMMLGLASAQEEENSSSRQAEVEDGDDGDGDVDVDGDDMFSLFFTNRNTVTQ